MIIDAALWLRLTSLERHFVIYPISFAVIAMYWISHHIQFHFVRYTDRPLIDATGLKGRYDMNFEVTPEEYQTLLIRAAVNSGVVLPPQALRLLDNGGDPLGNAVGQLGLKLDSRKAPVELFVVDSVLKTPRDN